MATPYDTIHLAQVESTQDVARREFAARDTVLVVADRQVGGRGRSGREWWEAPRAMYSSLAVAPDWAPESWSVIPLMAGLAVRSALSDEFGISIGLKWPNDLLIGDAKVGGILVEASSDLVVVGCGVNLWWPDPPAGVAAAATQDPGDESGALVATQWVEGLLARLADGPGRWGLDEYRTACLTLGEAIEWSASPDVVREGRAVDVGAAGELLVDTAEGRVALRSGEVRHVRTATLPADAGSAEGDQL